MRLHVNMVFGEGQVQVSSLHQTNTETFAEVRFPV